MGGCYVDSIRKERDFITLFSRLLKNDENIEITSNTELASKYSREFKRLKRECKILTEDQLLNVH